MSDWSDFVVLALGAVGWGWILHAIVKKPENGDHDEVR